MKGIQYPGPNGPHLEHLRPTCAYLRSGRLSSGITCAGAKDKKPIESDEIKLTLELCVSLCVMVDALVDPG